MGAALKPGDPAPALDLPTAGGGRVSLKKLRGKPAVVYFYPKDDTPGCTTEALNFTEMADEFASAGVSVIGVSKDPVSSHDKFAAKHGLRVTLASDEDGEAVKAWGVWGKKKLYGREFMGIERATFLVGADGKIAHAWRKVRVPGHVEDVLEKARALKPKGSR